MQRLKEVYYFDFWELFYHSSVSPNENIVRIEELAFGYSLGNPAPITSNPELTSLYKWGVSRQLVTADNSLINALLNILQDVNPILYRSDKETLTASEKALANSRFYSWIRRTYDEYQKRFDLLNKTASELLADVKTTVTNERLEDNDGGRDTSATSDMPITATFEDSLESPETLEDKLTNLTIAQRDYSHLWKDQSETEDPRGTLPERISQALEVWRDMVSEWAAAFLDAFAILEDKEDEI